MADADDDEEMLRFRAWLGKQQQEGRRKRLDEAPAPGMRPDRSIEFVRPYQRKPQPRIVKRFAADPADISDLHDYDYLFFPPKKDT
jgi:hypothetical protein